MKKKILFLVVAVVSICFGAQAQDPHFSQFYANPLYTNPALAGTAVCPRFSLSYRNQWPGLDAFKTFTASYDQHFDFLSGGIGAMIMSDAQSDFYRTNTAALIYSLRLKLARDVFFNIAAQASLTNRSLDWDQLAFPDMIDPRYGFIYTTMAERPGDLSHTYFDVAAGMVVYGENWFVGASAANLLRPDDGFMSYNRIPIRFTANAGMRFNLARDQRRTNAFFGAPIISPNVIYSYQGNFQMINYGLYLDWSPFIVGAWFRQSITFDNLDTLVLMFGVQHNSFKIGYSYDITVSKLSNVSGGAHEITLGAKLPCPEKRKRVKPIKCPSF